MAPDTLRSEAAIDQDSVLAQAERYQLTTAKLPIDSLTRTWSIGSNRAVDDNHVRSLSRIFEEQGLQREDPRNYMRVACSRADVERMERHVNSINGGLFVGDDNPKAPLVCFLDWEETVGSKLEIMAGQHRLEALKKLLYRKGGRCGSALERDQSWWICVIYDEGEYTISRQSGWLTLSARSPSPSSQNQAPRKPAKLYVT
jgi:hypothetical protein